MRPHAGMRRDYVNTNTPHSHTHTGNDNTSHTMPPSCEARHRTSAAMLSSRYATLRPHGNNEDTRKITAATTAIGGGVQTSAASYSARNASSRLRGRPVNTVGNTTSMNDPASLGAASPTITSSSHAYGLGTLPLSGASPRVGNSTRGNAPLRYRTDLDKPVIHFAFAHAAQKPGEEVLVPRASAMVPPSPTNTTTTTTTTTTTSSTRVAAMHGTRNDDPHALPTPSSVPSHTDLNTNSSTSSRSRSSSSSSASDVSLVHERVGRVVATTVVPVAETNNAAEGADDIVTNTLLGEWNVFWMSVGRVHAIFASTEFRLGDTQIINHFPNHHELTRKDLMYKNIKRYLREAHAGRAPMSNTTSPVTAPCSSPTSMTLFASQAQDAASHTRRGVAMALGERARFSRPAAQPLRPLTLLYPLSWSAAKACAEAAGGGSSNTMTTSTSNNNASGNVNNTGALTRAMSSALSLGAFCFADSVPVTYNIPNDLNMFIEEFKRRPNQTWIVKPAARSQGKGIFLINRIQQLTRRMRRANAAAATTTTVATTPPCTTEGSAGNEAKTKEESNKNARRMNTKGAKATQRGSPASGKTARVAAAKASSEAHTKSARREATARAQPASSSSEKVKPTSSASDETVLGSFIISKYIADPLLIAGRKFDLRLYVLVLSFKPLMAYLHKCGFARCCSTPYNSADLAEEDLGAHLTNVALQKHDAHYNTLHGGKLTLDNLWLYIQGRYGPYAAEALLTKIEYLIYHSLRAVEDVIFNDKHSFELYGYDVLIDSALEPHLIEVNASPSLSTTTDADRWLKEEVLIDTLRLVLPPHFPSPRAMPYWEYRTRIDLIEKQRTGFHRIQF